MLCIMNTEINQVDLPSKLTVHRRQMCAMIEIQVHMCEKYCTRH